MGGGRGGGGVSALPPDDVGISTRIPSIGRAVRFTLRLRAPADAPLRAGRSVLLHVGGREVARQTVTLDLAAAEFLDVPLSWTPTADGWHTLTFSVQTTGAKPAVVARLTRTLPVTARPLYFVWFGAPQSFQWCNVPTTVEKKDVEWWRWRGAWPCAWKAGVCNKAWSAAQFTASYNDAPCIAIDEVGPLDALGTRIMDAVRAHKAAHPGGLRAIWFMGAHPYWRDFRDCVDLYVPEIYLNYGSNHLGAFDRYLRVARGAGVSDRMIPGLGINVITDDQKRPKVTPTKADVLRQIRHLKAIAPDLRGVGFFTSSSAAPGVAEYGDQLCLEYYIRPVLSVVPGSLRARAKGKSVTLTARLRNCGGMAARAARVEFGEGYGAQFRALALRRLPSLPAGQEVEVTATLPGHDGVRLYGARVPPAEGVTILNEAEWAVVARSLPTAGPVLCLPAAPAAGGIPCFATVPEGAGVALAYPLTPDGRRGEPAAACVLPGLPGSKTVTLSWVPRQPDRERPQAYQMAEGPPAPTAPPAMARQSGDTLTAAGAGYVAVLDLAGDRITSLRTTVGPEILGSPWVFACTGHEGFQKAQVRESPAGVLVTLPFAGEKAEGFSRYFLYRHAAVIRVERFFRPRGVVQVASSSEGCRFPQQGGVYALQAGVGGPVQRGELRDGTTYRDLLFGYLGEAPGAGNADKAGWFDFCTPQGAGLGVAIGRRWSAAHSDVSYDVTRYYDGGDWIQVMNLWGKELSIGEPQSQILYLVPHAPVDLRDAGVTPPAQALWESVHHPATVVPGL